MPPKFQDWEIQHTKLMNWNTEISQIIRNEILISLGPIWFEKTISVFTNSYTSVTLLSFCFLFLSIFIENCEKLKITFWCFDYFLYKIQIFENTFHQIK